MKWPPGSDTVTRRLQAQFRPRTSWGPGNQPRTFQLARAEPKLATHLNCSGVPMLVIQFRTQIHILLKCLGTCCAECFLLKHRDYGGNIGHGASWLFLELFRSLQTAYYVDRFLAQCRLEIAIRPTL